MIVMVRMIVMILRMMIEILVRMIVMMVLIKIMIMKTPPSPGELWQCWSPPLP